MRIRNPWLLVAACWMFISASALGAGSPERRVALVIGNSAYASSPLLNPANDATDIASALERHGFSVIREIDADRRTMRRAIRKFGRAINEGAVGLFYYAGHGIQVDGENYLVPVGAEVLYEDEVPDECLEVSSVLRKMETAGNRLNIIILDACRDNPFARSFRSGIKGLAKMDAPAGSLLAYATAPGSTAADGSDRNGLYTSHLLRHMAEPGLALEKIFKKVRIDVMQASGNRQIPWESSSLTGDFYFSKPAPASAPSPATGGDSPSQMALLEAERAKLEAERIKLEAERKLSEQRRQMELEKVRMEKERAALAAEAAEAERRRLAAETKMLEERKRLAEEQRRMAEARSALASGATLAALPSAKRFRLAILPMLMDVPSKWKNNGPRRIVRLVEGIQAMLEDRRDISLDFSYYEAGGLSKRVRRIEDAVDQKAHPVWERKSISSLPEFNPASAAAHGRKIGADLGISVMMRAKDAEWGNDLVGEVYLVDLKTGEVTRKKLDFRHDIHTDAIPVTLDNIEEMLDALAAKNADAG